MQFQCGMKIKFVVVVVVEQVASFVCNIRNSYLRQIQTVDQTGPNVGKGLAVWITCLLYNFSFLCSACQRDNYLPQLFYVEVISKCVISVWESWVY